MKSKNLCAKRREVSNPYETWRSFDGSWIWKILKKYQVSDDKPFARAFCAVYSPITREQMRTGYELGDVYISEIKRQAVRIDD